MDCPKCKSGSHIKFGIVKGRQRYQCKTCGYHYSVEKRAGTVEPEIKNLALRMYLEGIGFRSIGRVIGVSEVAVINWVKEKGLKVKPLQVPSAPVSHIQMDELHTLCPTKKMWSGYGRQLMKEAGNGWILS